MQVATEAVETNIIIKNHAFHEFISANPKAIIINSRSHASQDHHHFTS